MKLEVLPLFSHPVGIIDIEEDFSLMREHITKLDFVDGGTYNFFLSDNKKILENFPREKKIIMSYFDSYKDQVLNIGPTDFSVTTSWITKTKRGGYTYKHRHNNSIYSGVFYFDDITDNDGGQFLLSKDYLYNSDDMFHFNCGSNNNIYNATSINIKPQKNRLVIFPSGTAHKVLESTSDRTRYSLAFNLFPIGSLYDLMTPINLSVS